MAVCARLDSQQRSARVDLHQQALLRTGTGLAASRVLGFLAEIWPLSSQGGVQAEQACLVLPGPVQISSAAHAYPGCELLLPPGLFPSCMLSRTEGFLYVHLRCQQRRQLQPELNSHNHLPLVGCQGKIQMSFTLIY